MENLKLTLIQSSLVWENAEANRDKFSAKIEDLKDDTDLILLPEMFSTGFSMNAENLAENTDGPTLNWLKEHAKNKNAAISGSVIVKENNNYFNRLYFVFPDGKHKIYDKRHLFSLAHEEKTYSPGTEKLIVNYKGWKICPLVCYDLRFPVWSRNVEDYDLLFYVANWPKKRALAWDALLKARAIENMCFTAGLNRVGVDGNDHDYDGHSAIYDMLGKKLTTQNWEKEFTQTITLNKSELKNTRKRFQFLKDRDEFEVL